MSADLFAEFNKPPSGPSQRQQQQQPQGNSLTTQPAENAQDPFGFLLQSNSAASPPQQPAQQWTGFQGQPSLASNSGFGAGPAPAQPAPADDDDGWGEFETAGESLKKSAQPSTVSWPTPGQPESQTMPVEQESWQSFEKISDTPDQADPWSVFEKADSSKDKPQPKPLAAFKHPEPGRLVRASTMDILTNNLVHASNPSSPLKAESSWDEPARRPQFREPSNPNVMFDAEDFELEGGDEDDDFDDDEFGDFETVAPSSTSQPHAPKAPAPDVAATQPLKYAQPPPSMDLLSLDEPEPAPPPIQRAQVAPEATGRVQKPFGFGATTAKSSKQGPKHSKDSSTSKITKSSKPVVAEDEEWGAWDSFESKPPSSTAIPESPAAVENWDWEPADPRRAAKPEVIRDEPPPVNVPPPSVLLSAFPSLFATGDSLFKPVSTQTASIKERVHSDPKAIEFLQGYILIATTAGHVVAGRKHRWHRDKILAKSMSISAAGSKGMKLAGVDKTQSKREDREAADVAMVWAEYLGRVRSAVAAANTSGKASLKVPEISENMQVQTAKMTPTAAKPCVICGLKREERVAKVDVDIEDSFGEWWVDHWGHRACKNFWLQHEHMLRQR